MLSATARTQDPAWLWNWFIRAGQNFFGDENAKGNFSSNAMPQATIIVKHDSLLVIFHPYYLPVRNFWPLKLIFLNPKFVLSSLPFHQFSGIHLNLLVFQFILYAFICSFCSIIHSLNATETSMIRPFTGLVADA